MSWMQRLYETYEAAMALDITDNFKPKPVSHSVQNAHINIVLGASGNFLRASVKNKFRIVLPATEDSANRTGRAPPPHPLNDKLQYVAADYPDFGGQKPSFFFEYRALLAEWCASEFTSPKVEAVLKYVDEKRVIRDLVDAKVLILDENNRLLTPESLVEIKGGVLPDIFKSIPKDTSQGRFDQGGALICWSVEIPGDPVSDTWSDDKLFKKWMRFDALRNSVSGLCLVTGKDIPIALKHPSKILKSVSGAKLISSDDDSGFTFRGRFTDSKVTKKVVGLQGGNVGFVVSQKVHSALGWLIERQGFHNKEQAIVAWATSGIEIPELLVATTEFDLDDFDEVYGTVEPSRNNADEPAIDQSTDLGQRFAAKLNAYMSGYRAKLSDSDQISIMAIDSATPGRIGVTYYREILPREYLDRLTQWHTDLAWPQRVVTEVPQKRGSSTHNVAWRIAAPSPLLILNATYGDILQSNKALKKNLIERLLPCITECHEIPRDLVYRAVSRACNRNSKRLSDQYSTRQSELAAWEKELAVACALYKGYLLRNLNRSEISMALEEGNTSRDYLYGRLLALADNIESYALNRTDEKRPTSAERFMQRFADRPFSTWRTIELSLRPYINRLKAGDEKSRGFVYSRTTLLSNIQGLFVDSEQFKIDKQLSGEFLLGFHCQRLALSKKSETNFNTEPEITEEQGA